MSRRTALAAIMGMLAFLPLAPAVLPDVNECSTIPAEQALEGPVPDTGASNTGIALGRLPCFFTENRGQLDDGRVAYYAIGDGISVGFTADGVEFVLSEASGKGAPSPDDVRPSKVTVARFSLRFDGAGPVSPQGRAPRGHASNHLLGNDPDLWVRGARDFDEVVYEGLYDGVDLRFYFRDGALKYDFALVDGRNFGQVRCRYEGIEGLSIDALSGDLLVRTRAGTLRDSRPVALDPSSSTMVGVPADFRLTGGTSWGFALPERLCDGRPVTIDPGLVFGTFIGGSGWDQMRCITTDDEGYIYVSGNIESPEFNITPGAYDAEYQVCKGVVLKLEPDGSDVVWSTYYGGKNYTGGFPRFNTHSKTISLRPDGSILLVGMTGLSDFPTTVDAYSRTKSGLSGTTDLFILVLGPDGDELVYGSYLGGSKDETCRAHILDTDGSLLILCDGYSEDMPVTTGAYCTTSTGGGDLNLIRLDSSLNKVLYCTYMGGTDWEAVSDLAIDAQGNVYIGAYSRSSDFPTTSGAFCTTVDDPFTNGIFMIFNRTGHLLYSTYIGGTRNDWVTQVKLAPNGTLYIVLETESDDFPIKGPGAHGLYGMRDAALLVFDSGMRLTYGTCIGGSKREAAQGALLDDSRGTLYLSISTESSNVATTLGSFCPLPVSMPFYECIIGINTSTLKTTYSTYIWSGAYWNTQDPYSVWGEVLAVDPDGAVLLTGYTNAVDFPTTPGAYCIEYQGGYNDGYIIKLDPRPVELPPAPAGVRATIDDALVNVSWEPYANISYITVKHYVYRGYSPGAINSRTAEVGYGADYYEDRNVENGVTYYYRISAVNGAGEGPRSETVNGTPMGYPTAPQALAATSGDGAVTLNWTSPASTGGVALLGYHVLRGLDRSSLVPIAQTGTSTGYRDTAGLEVGKTYHYAVMAFNERGNGSWSSVVPCKVTRPPSAPLNLAVDAGNGSLTLTWDEPASLGGGTLLGYQVYNGTEGGPFGFLGTTLPTQRTYVHVGLMNGQRYVYRVTATTDVGEGEAAEVEGMPGGPPGRPTAIAARGGNGTIALSWEPPSSDGGQPVIGYLVYGGPSEESITFLQRVDGSTTYRHVAENGATWYFAVSALNSLGEGERSAAVRADAMGVPSAPTGLTGRLLPAGIELSWGEPGYTGGAPNLTYRVLRGTSEGALSTVAEVAIHLSWLDEDVQLGTTYHYRVQAVNPNGDAGEPSALFSVRFVTATPPGAPSNLTARAGNMTVHLEWSAPATDGGSPVIRYVVQRGREAGNLSEVAIIMGLRYDDYDPVLENGVTYRYAVRAENAVGVGPASEVIQARPLPPPGRPVLTAKAKGSDVALSWTPPAGEYAAATGYVVLRGTDPLNLTVVAELGTVTGYIDEGVEPGRTYYYSVRARSGSGDGPASDPVQVKVEGSVGAASWVLPALIGLAITITLLAGALMMRGRRGGAPIEASRDGTMDQDGF